MLYFEVLSCVIFDNLLVGIISGVVASLIFFIWIRGLKPKINISNKISKLSCGKYKVKVVNLSKFEVINVKVCMEIVEVLGDASGDINYCSQIKLVSGDVFYLPKYNKKAASCRYARRFTTKCNLEEWFDNNGSKFIRFTIYAENEFSGIGKIFSKEYKKEDIVKGEFCKGKSMDIESI